MEEKNKKIEWWGYSFPILLAILVSSQILLLFIVCSVVLINQHITKGQNKTNLLQLPTGIPIFVVEEQRCKLRKE